MRKVRSTNQASKTGAIRKKGQMSQIPLHSHLKHKNAVTDIVTTSGAVDQGNRESIASIFYNGNNTDRPLSVNFNSAVRTESGLSERQDAL